MKLSQKSRRPKADQAKKKSASARNSSGVMSLRSRLARKLITRHIARHVTFLMIDAI